MKKSWIFAVIYCVVVIPLTIQGIITLGVEGEGVPDETRLIPVWSFEFDTIALRILSPIIMIIFIQFLSIILALGLYKLHILMKLKKYDYFIFNNIEKEKETHFLVVLRRAFTLGLFALSIGMFMYEILDQDLLVSSDVSGTITPIHQVSNAGFFILPFLILILAPIWLLRDSGIMCKRRDIIKEKRKLPDIEGVYSHFEVYITGYIGVGALFTLILLFNETFQLLDPETGEIGDIPQLLLTPLYFIIMTFPALTFYELRLKSMREKLIIKLEEKGLHLVDKIDVTLTNK